MAQVNPYLTFNGSCEEAFNFYKSVFGGEFAHIGKFKDMPSENKVLIDVKGLYNIKEIGEKGYKYWRL